MRLRYSIYFDVSSKHSDGSCSVRVVFLYGTKRFTVNSGLRAWHRPINRVFPSNEPNARAKNIRLSKLCYDIDNYLLRYDVGNSVSGVRSDGCKSFADMKVDLQCLVSGKPIPVKSFINYMDEYIKTKRNESTKSILRATYNKVKYFDVCATFATINKEWLVRFSNYCRRTMRPNSLAVHLHNIRAVFNWCIDNDITEYYPFRRFPIKHERTAINDISVEQLRQFRDKELVGKKALYRDLFMLSFYLCGINIGDMLLLKHENIKDGRVVYRRQKTGNMYDVPLIPEAKEIIDRYNGKQYLLKIMDRYKTYQPFLHNMNKQLKKVSGISNLTTYTARYTFACIGAELDIPREIIALCLGHSWSDVTSCYIHYNRKKIDEAVDKIVKYVNEGNE